MKKSISTLAALVLVGSLAAQNSQLSVGVDVAQPLGDFGDVYNAGVGPAVGFELPVGSRVGVTAQVAYDFMSPKSEYSDFLKKSTMIPAHLGLKYYFMDQQYGCYLSGQAGVHSTSAEIADEKQTDTNFSWAGSLGYQFKKLDINVRYSAISPGDDAADDAKSSNYVGLRVAYLLGL